MNNTHDVISAFLDDEPFDSSTLAEALSEPAGRDLLIDLIVPNARSGARSGSYSPQGGALSNFGALAPPPRKLLPD